MNSPRRVPVESAGNTAVTALADLVGSIAQTAIGNLESPNEGVHVGLEVTMEPPHAVVSVLDLVDPNFTKQGVEGYTNETVMPGDRILEVDSHPAEHISVDDLRVLLRGRLYSVCELLLARQGPGQQEKVFTVRVLRHRYHEFDEVDRANSPPQHVTPTLVQKAVRSASQRATAPIKNEMVVKDEVVDIECIRIMQGHSELYCCVWSEADGGGRWVLTSSADQTLRLWDVVDGTCRKVLKGHTGEIWSCSLSSRDGGRRWALSGSRDKSSRIFDIDSGECVMVLTGHTGSIYSCQFSVGSSNGAFALTSSADKTLRVWDIFSGMCTQVLEGHVASVCFCQWSIADGGSRWVLSGSDDETVRLWDLEAGQNCLVLEGHTGPVLCGAWSNAHGGRKWIISGSWDKELKLWDGISGQSIKTLSGHIAPVYGCGWSQGDGGARWVISASYDESIRLWDVASGACMQSLLGHSGWVRCCKWSNGEGGKRWLMSGSRDKTLRLWECAWNDANVARSGSLLLSSPPASPQPVLNPRVVAKQRAAPPPTRASSPPPQQTSPPSPPKHVASGENSLIPSSSLARAIELTHLAADLVAEEQLCDHKLVGQGDTETIARSSLTTIGLMYDEPSKIISNVLVAGPAFNSKKVFKGDTLVTIDGQDSTTGDLLAMIRGCDKPDSVVTIGLKRATGEAHEVKLRRMANCKLADKRIMFELFHKMLNQAKVNNDKEMEKLVQECLDLWTEEMSEESEHDARVAHRLHTLQQSCATCFHELLQILQASFPFDGEHNTNIQIQKSERKAATRSAPPPAPEMKQLRAELAAALEGNEQLKAELAKLMAELAKARQAGADVEQINAQLNAEVAKGRHEIKDSNSKLRESIEVADRLHSELLQARAAAGAAKGKLEQVKGEALKNSQDFAIMQTKFEAELIRKTEELKRKEEDFAILQRKFGDIRDELKKNDEEVKDQYQKDFQTLMLEKNGLENALVQETKELQASQMRMNIAELNSKKDRVENERLEGGVSKYLATIQYLVTKLRVDMDEIGIEGEKQVAKFEFAQRSSTPTQSPRTKHAIDLSVPNGEEDHCSIAPRSHRAATRAAAPATRAPQVIVKDEVALVSCYVAPQVFQEESRNLSLELFSIAVMALFVVVALVLLSSEP